MRRMFNQSYYKSLKLAIEAAMSGPFEENTEALSQFDCTVCTVLEEHVETLVRSSFQSRWSVLYGFLHFKDEEENVLRDVLGRSGLLHLPHYVFMTLISTCFWESGFFEDQSSKKRKALLFEPSFWNQPDEAVRAFILEHFEDRMYLLLIFALRFYSDEQWQRVMSVCFSGEISKEAILRFFYHVVVDLDEEKMMRIFGVLKESGKLESLIWERCNDRLFLGAALEKNCIEASLFLINEMQGPIPRGVGASDLFILASQTGKKEVFMGVFNLLTQENVSLYSLGLRQALLLHTSLNGLNALESCIQSQNEEGVLFLFELYLRVLTKDHLRKFFCQTRIRRLESYCVHQNFFHFLGAHFPIVIFKIYERLRLRLEEPLHTCLLRLNSLGMRALDYVSDPRQKNDLCSKMPSTDHRLKVLVLDIDGTLLVKKTSRALRELREHKHYVAPLDALNPRYAYLRRSALRAIILWVMYHPEFRLYVVTNSERESPMLVKVLRDITGASQEFILNQLDGYFSRCHLRIPSYMSFLKTRPFPLPSGFEGKKYLHIEYLLSQEAVSLTDVEVCFYDDKEDILKDAAEHAPFRVRPVRADLLSGSVASLQEVAQFCGIDQMLSPELPMEMRRLLEPLQSLYREAIAEDFIEDKTLGKYPGEAVRCSMG